jgi:Trypsin-co-occurring domain 2
MWRSADPGVTSGVSQSSVGWSFALPARRPWGVYMPDGEPGIPLADLVDAIRGELETAALNARDQQLQFEVKDVQLEVEITTTGMREGGGGLKIYVLTLGAKGSKSNASSQKVTLNLSAVTADGSQFRVRDMSSKPIRQDDE